MMNQSGPSPQEQILNLISNPSEAKKQINDFAMNFQGDPKQRVEQLVNSGQMSQQQYNFISRCANALMKFM